MPTESNQSGSEKLIQDLEKMYSDLNSEVENKLIELGEKVKAIAIENTPVSSKRVIKGYKVSKPKHRGHGKMYVKVSNSETGFDTLETGYETMNEKGHVDGYVRGKHMLENAYTQVNKNVMAEFDELIKRVME